MQSQGAGGTVRRIWRYPVKSLCGEEMDHIEVDRRGLARDRQLAIYNPDGKIASGKETRRFCRIPGLLMASARTQGQDVILHRGQESVAVSDPQVHERISNWFGQPLTLAKETQISHFDELPVSLLTTAALDQVAGWLDQGPVEPSRFRANVLIDAPGEGCIEDDWVGHRLVFASGLRLEVVSRITRCVMITMRSVTAPPDLRVLSVLADRHDACLGVVARVVQPGAIEVGAQIQLD